MILAAANLNKFIENISLINKSLQAQIKSIDIQADNLKAQTKSIDIQAEALKAQAKSIDLQTDSLKTQAKSVDLQAKDLLLNHKPVVFIKGVLPPAEKNTSNPFAYGFILTNSGKLPARDLEIIYVPNFVTVGLTFIDNIVPDIILNKASLYPGSDLVVWLPSVTNLTNFIKAEINFFILYKGDGIDGQMEEKMKFINTDQTMHKWVYVGPDYDIFKAERAAMQHNDKRSPEEKVRGKKFMEGK